MKKIFSLSFLMLAIVTGSIAQSAKNDLKLTVSGLPLFGSSESFSSGINGAVVKPAIGYYISDKTSIELNFSYASLCKLTIGNTDSHYHSYAFVPTLRNSFINQQKLRVFAEIGLGFGTIRYDAYDRDLRSRWHEELSGGISVLTAGIGANYFFNETFGIELLLPYISTKNITSDAVSDLYSGVGPSVGFTYLL